MFDPCREHVADGGAASHGLGLEPFLEHGVELHRDLEQLSVSGRMPVLSYILNVSTACATRALDSP